MHPGSSFASLTKRTVVRWFFGFLEIFCKTDEAAMDQLLLCRYVSASHASTVVAFAVAMCPGDRTCCFSKGCGAIKGFVFLQMATEREILKCPFYKKKGGMYKLIFA